MAFTVETLSRNSAFCLEFQKSITRKLNLLVNIFQRDIILWILFFPPCWNLSGFTFRTKLFYDSGRSISYKRPSKGPSIKYVRREGGGDLRKSVHPLFGWRHSFVKMRKKREMEGVKYLTYLSVRTLWMAPKGVLYLKMERFAKDMDPICCWLWSYYC